MKLTESTQTCFGARLYDYMDQEASAILYLNPVFLQVLVLQNTPINPIFERKYSYKTEIIQIQSVFHGLTHILICTLVFFSYFSILLISWTMEYLKIQRVCQVISVIFKSDCQHY